MRAFSSSGDLPLKKPPLDIVEVVGELVDLTAASDDAASDGGKKKDKKARKEQKRKEKERKREELKQAEAAKRKAAREDRLVKEAAAEAQRKADLAALRAAARRECYDRSLLQPTTEPVESPEPVKDSPKKRQRLPEGNHQQEQKLPLQSRPEPPLLEEPEPVALIEVPPVISEVAPLLSEAAPAPTLSEVAARMRESSSSLPPKATEEKKAASKKAQGKSMAEAIAAAQKEQNLGGFASFEGFDAQASHEKAHGLETEELDDDDEVNPEGLLPAEFYSLQDLPEELTLGKMGSEPGLYIAHYIRYVLGAWRRMLGSGKALGGSGLTNQTAALFQSQEKFQSTADALKPLLRQLRNRAINEEMLSGLETVVKLAAEREYNHANSVYVGMTMGRKTWHNSLPCFQQQQNHGGSVRKIIKQSELVDFDWDPVVQAYMHALKRVVQFAQCILPPDDPAKCA